MLHDGHKSNERPDAWPGWALVAIRLSPTMVALATDGDPMPPIALTEPLNQPPDPKRLAVIADQLSGLIAELKSLTEPAICGQVRPLERRCHLLEGHAGPHVALTAPVDEPQQVFWWDADPEVTR